MLASLITRVVGWAVGVYFQVERRGPPLPPGPVLVVANHPNALLDPLVIFRTAGRRTRPLAKAPLFDQALVGSVLRGLGGLPVYRRQDDPTQVHRNERTFDAAVGALRAGEAVQIYPEGQSHSGLAMSELKTGAARIAFLAEEGAGWELGLEIVPIGLTYERKHLFRGRAVATIGEGVSLDGYRSAYADDPQETVRRLTGELRTRLEAVTLNYEAPGDPALVEAAESLYARVKGVSRWREDDSLGKRLPRLQAFANGLAWLRAHDPSEVARLEAEVRRHEQITILLGARHGEVPPRFGRGAVAWYVVRELTLLLLAAPLVLVATLAWGLAYAVPRLVVRAVKPNQDAISTYKLGASLLVFPLTLTAWSLLAWWLGGLSWMGVTLFALPVSGLAWIGWTERWRRVREDVRVFLRSAPRRRTRERLAEMRAALVEDFDRIAELVGSNEGDAR